MHAGNDADFADWLLLLGSGQLPTVDGVQDTVEIPREMVCDVIGLIDFVYPQHMLLANVDGFARKIVLCPRNEECRQINRIEGAERTYTAINTVVIDDPDEEANYPTEFLNSLELNGLPPFKLTLRVGAIVMFLRNLDPKRKLCNGTRLVVTELRLYNFRARMLSGEGSAQDDVIIPAIPITAGGEDDLPFKMKRVQFPVRLSFAMTINKSQTNVEELDCSYCRRCSLTGNCTLHFPESETLNLSKSACTMMVTVDSSKRTLCTGKFY